MKAWCILLALVGVASASPMPQRPPLERNCIGPMPWDGVQKCIDRWEKGAKIRELSPEVKAVRTQGSREYLFARIGEVWRLAYQMGDADYELVQRSTLTVAALSYVRIDLSHHMALGNDGVFFERVTVVCGGTALGCQAAVTACTVLKHGRAVETFRGELKIEAGGVAVVGDRSYSGPICRGR